LIRYDTCLVTAKSVKAHKGKGRKINGKKWWADEARNFVNRHM
jgi:hypothetical protein